MPKSNDVLLSVVTATIGRPDLERACASVLEAAAALRNGVVEHLVVIDGPQFEAAARAVVDRFKPTGFYRPMVFAMPYNTKKDGTICRQAGAVLARGRYVSFLDDDNWYAKSHLSDCLTLLDENPRYDWMHTARWVVPAGLDEAGAIEDCAESLGLLHSLWNNRLENHVDTNCYVMKTEVARAAIPCWVPISGNWGDDRRLYAGLLKQGRPHLFLFKPTVYYRATPSIMDSVRRGNERQQRSLERYKGKVFRFRFTRPAGWRLSLKLRIKAWNMRSFAPSASAER